MKNILQRGSASDLNQGSSWLFRQQTTGPSVFAAPGQTQPTAYAQQPPGPPPVSQLQNNPQGSRQPTGNYSGYFPNSGSAGTGAFGSMSSGMDPTASSWSLGGGGGGSGPRVGTIGADNQNYSADHPRPTDDGLRKDRKSLPKLNLDQGQVKNPALVSEKLERWIYGLQLAISTWSSGAALYFEQCLLDARRRYDQWLVLDSRERALMELTANTLRSGFTVSVDNSTMLEKILRVELLDSVPPWAKTTALQSNRTSTIQILVCVYTQALSGEAQTRASLLSSIEKPLPYCKTAGQAADALRAVSYTHLTLPTICSV